MMIFFDRFGFNWHYATLEQTQSMLKQIVTGEAKIRLVREQNTKGFRPIGDPYDVYYIESCSGFSSSLYVVGAFVYVAPDLSFQVPFSLSYPYKVGCESRPMTDYELTEYYRRAGRKNNRVQRPTMFDNNGERVSYTDITYITNPNDRIEFQETKVFKTAIIVDGNFELEW